MFKRILKIFITDFKKRTLYGDCHAWEKDSWFYPFRGKSIKVKILGIFWITYKYYETH